MRITTQMLNRSAQKAGLPTNRTSLLNYINGNNSNVSLASALSKSTRAADTTKKSEYEKLEKSADQAAAATDKLLSAGSENATATDLQAFVDKYNEMLKSLGNSSDTLSLFYAQTAKDTVKEYQQELAEVGITMAKDGTLSFDKAKFEKFNTGNTSGETPATDADATDSTVSETGNTTSGAARPDVLFAKEGGFFSKLNYLASRVSDYADANAESYSDHYNAVGSKTGLLYANSKYNFWS